LEINVAGLFESLSIVWRLAAPYFRSEERLKARALLIVVVAVQLATVTMTVLVNKWYNGFYGALQDRNFATFMVQIGYFGLLAGAITLLSAAQLYLNQWLEIRWRRWMTRSFLGDWLRDATHYRLQLVAETADNPDQRIAEDIRLFIDQGLTIGVGLLGALVSIASFVVILWQLSAGVPIPFLASGVSIPGYLVWVAIIYALVGTTLTHLIGRPLTRLNFEQQRYEADFRFNLVRVRENSEQIALLGGEEVETENLLKRFERVAANWYAIMSRQKWLTFFTTSYTQVAIIFPIVVVSPAYFTGTMQLGGLIQTAAAFATVQGAMSFFINIYPNFAQWRAVIARLDGFERAVSSARALGEQQSYVTPVSHETADGLTIEGLSVELPTGRPLMASQDLTIKAGQSTLITGPSGSGKSTFFRAVAGVWPFSTGTVVVPRGAKLMVLPQRPYFSISSLEEAVSYPAPRGTFPADRVADVVRAVGLPDFADRLPEEAHWNQILSLGQQQKLSIARAILHAPDFLFLDEATASLDEAGEAALYALLQQRLPGVTTISIGHRSTLDALHDRRLTMQPEENRHYMREAVQH
jgi:putative ATP-binding cassette transporter